MKLSLFYGAYVMKYVIMVFNIHTVEINYIFDSFFPSSLLILVVVVARSTAIPCCEIYRSAYVCAWLCVKMKSVLLFGGGALF